MAVVVQCFHCNAVLELDEGFRGGVCRCSSCGSLLQVPRGDGDAPPTGRRVRPATPGSGPKKSGEAAGAGDTGLSGTVGGLSSGALSSSGLSSGMRVHRTKPVAPASSGKSGSGGSSAAGKTSREARTGSRGAGERLESAGGDGPMLPTTMATTTLLPGAPAMQELRRASWMLWVALGLGLLLAIAVLISVIVYMSHGG